MAHLPACCFVFVCYVGSALFAYIVGYNVGYNSERYRQNLPCSALMGGSLVRNSQIEQWLEDVPAELFCQVYLCVFYPDSPPCKCLPRLFEAKRGSNVFLKGRILHSPYHMLSKTCT